MNEVDHSISRSRSLSSAKRGAPGTPGTGMTSVSWNTRWSIRGRGERPVATCQRRESRRLVARSVNAGQRHVATLEIGDKGVQGGIVPPPRQHQVFGAVSGRRPAP